MQAFETPRRIFISYHRPDTEPDAGRLADSLKRRFGQERVFTDVTGIEPGGNWKRVIARALEEAVVVLVVIGPNWELTEPIRHEIAPALAARSAIIPILVRRADLRERVSRTPPEFHPLLDIHAVALDHRKWDADVEGLARTIESMLDDPARARIFCAPPNPMTVLQEGVVPDNPRALLAHAADLSECLDDSSVLTRAKELSRLSTGDAQAELIELLGAARFRVMIDQLAKSLLDLSGRVRPEDIASFLDDRDLALQLERAAADFETGKRTWIQTRGDDGDPRGAQEWMEKLREQAVSRLREYARRFENPDTRTEVVAAMARKVEAVLERGAIENRLEVTMIEHYLYPNMAPHLTQPLKVQAMLEEFSSRQTTAGDGHPTNR